MKEFLKLWEDGRPGLLVFEDCRRFIKDVSAVQHDEKNPSDVAKEPHEYTHTNDAIRYLCAFRAMGAEPVVEEEELEEGLTGYDEYMTGGETGEDYLSYGGR